MKIRCLCLISVVVNDNKKTKSTCRSYPPIHKRILYMRARSRTRALSLTETLTNTPTRMHTMHMHVYVRKQIYMQHAHMNASARVYTHTHTHTHDNVCAGETFPDGKWLGILTGGVSRVWGTRQKVPPGDVLTAHHAAQGTF